MKNFKRFSLKMLRYKARAFPVGTAYDKSAIFFTPWKMCMRIYLDHMASSHFALGRDVFVSSIIGHWQ